MVVWCPGAIVTQKKSRCCQITARTATSADDVMCTKRTFPQAPIRGLAGAHARKQDPHRTHRLLPSPPRKKQGLAPSHLTFRILRQTFSAEHPDCILTQTRFVLLRSLRHCDAAISLPSSYPSPLPPLASRHVMSPRLTAACVQRGIGLLARSSCSLRAYSTGIVKRLRPHANCRWPLAMETDLLGLIPPSAHG